MDTICTCIQTRERGQSDKCVIIAYSHGYEKADWVGSPQENGAGNSIYL